MSIVELKNVTKRYNDKLVVDNLSFSIKEGEIFGLLGPNGAGKSTTISIIVGLIKNDGGEIIINGYSINSNPSLAKKSIGLVPQDIALYKNLSAVDNLRFWGTLYGLQGKELKNRIDEALEVTGLADRKKEKINNFSGGMKRRINIASAIMHHPKILIMDEPTVGIDPQSRNHILEFTKDLNKKYNTTIIYTSHYMEEVESLCNKLVILDEGKLVASGTKEEIKRIVSNEETLSLTVTNFNPDILLKLKHNDNINNSFFKNNILSISVKNCELALPFIIDVLVSNKIKIQNISIDTPSLETVFLKLTGKNLRDK